MSQKFKKIQNKNDESTAFGKWFATAVYDQHFIETEQLLKVKKQNKILENMANNSKYLDFSKEIS